MVGNDTEGKSRDDTGCLADLVGTGPLDVCDSTIIRVVVGVTAHHAQCPVGLATQLLILDGALLALCAAGTVAAEDTRRITAAPLCAVREPDEVTNVIVEALVLTATLFCFHAGVPASHVSDITDAALRACRTTVR